MRASEVPSEAPAPVERVLFLTGKQRDLDSDTVEHYYGTVRFRIEPGYRFGQSAPIIEGNFPSGWVVAAGSGAVRLQPKVEVGKENGINLVPIEIVNKDKAKVAELRVSKLQDSIDTQNVLDIDADDDRFYVRVPGLVNVQKVSIKLGTEENPIGEYNDDPTEIELIRKDGGWETRSLILVSDTEDDKEEGGGIGKDNEKNDRSHKIQLGGKVHVSELIVDGNSKNVDIKVPVPVKARVTINAVVLADAGPVNLNAEIKTVNERLAQVGVRVTLADGDLVKPLPEDYPDTSTIVRFNIPAQNNAPYPEAIHLINEYGTISIVDDIHVFFVKETLNLAPGAIEQVRGFVYWDEPKNGAYKNNVFISSGHGPYTMAHELVHLLTNRGHYNPHNPEPAGRHYAAGAEEHKSKRNLMWAPTSDNRGGFSATKRLYEESGATQETWIRAHPAVKALQ